MPDLEDVEMRIERHICAEDRRLAEAVYQILRNVQVSRSIKMTLYCPWFAGVRCWSSRESPLEHQAQLSDAVRSEISIPGSLTRSAQDPRSSRRRVCGERGKEC